jgi:hypothetical protein
MLFERHSLKVNGPVLQSLQKELQKTGYNLTYKSKEKQVGMANIT